MIAKSVFDYSWIDDIKTNQSVLLIAEGMLMYFTKHEVTGLLNKLVESFHNAEMILETIAASLVKQSENQNLIKKTILYRSSIPMGDKKRKKFRKNK